MKNFIELVKAVFFIFITITGIVVIVFGGLYLYNSNPELFTKSTKNANTWSPKNVVTELANNSMSPEVKFGYQLISQSSKYMGPKAKDPKMHYAGNNLACVNCHLKDGTQPGSASWIGVTQRFPQFRGRSNKEGTIEDRINGCMERSMNGKKLPIDSKPMKAIVAYMEWLGEGLPKNMEKEYKGFTSLDIPKKAVDLSKGKKLFSQQCAVCHGENGMGKWFEDPLKGYQYPPLWGDDSFNNGAGMHRVITAAQFIKANMPFGEATKKQPKLTDEEAYNLAGYINSFNRPIKNNLEKDYPDLKLKPVSTSYGPWADNFSAKQHQFGPFPPIIDYYKKKYGIQKNK